MSAVPMWQLILKDALGDGEDEVMTKFWAAQHGTFQPMFSLKTDCHEDEHSVYCGVCRGELDAGTMASFSPCGALNPGIVF